MLPTNVCTTALRVWLTYTPSGYLDLNPVVHTCLQTLSNIIFIFLITSSVWKQYINIWIVSGIREVYCITFSNYSKRKKHKHDVSFGNDKSGEGRACEHLSSLVSVIHSASSTCAETYRWYCCDTTWHHIHHISLKSFHRDLKDILFHEGYNNWNKNTGNRV